MPALCQARMQLILLATLTVMLPNNSLALIDLPPPMVAAHDFTSFNLWTNAAIMLTIFLLPVYSRRAA